MRRKGTEAAFAFATVFHFVLMKQFRMSTRCGRLLRSSIVMWLTL
jgi:hypothetical protein